MTIELPKLAGTSIEYYSMCGRVVTEKSEIQELAKKYNKRIIIYNLDSPGGVLNARVIFGKMKDYFHVHIDLATTESFGKSNPPKPSRDAPSFNDILSPFLGEKVDVFVFGRSTCSLEKLPPVFAILQKSSIGTGGITLKITKATISVEGAPIQKIHWKQKENDENLYEIILEGATEMLFSESYFVDGLAFIKTYADAFMSKGIPNV